MDTEIAIINNVISMTDTSGPVKKTGIGARLKEAREGMNLSEKEAAARLYLSLKVISIIENETFAEGPPATFMRGYMHSYARLLNFPEADINTALKQLELDFPKNRDTTHVLHAQPLDHSERYIRWITLFIVVVLVLLVCIWWNSHSKYTIADVPTKITATQPAAPKMTISSKPVPTAAPMITPVPVNSPPAKPIPATTPPAAIARVPTSTPPAAVTSTSSSTDKKAIKKSRHQKRIKKLVMSVPEAN